MLKAITPSTLAKKFLNTTSNISKVGGKGESEKGIQIAETPGSCPVTNTP